ncbi:MAG: hypothetical protein E7334_01570 [Clostridiales bacterium]|nr:hypothetical protein [Clostridiales bacterium]
MKTTVAAVDIGTSKIVCVIGEFDDDLSGELIGYGVKPYDGYSGFEWNQSEEDVADAVSGAIHLAYEMCGRQADSVYVSVPASWVSVIPCTGNVSVEGGKVSEDDMKAAFDNAVPYVADRSMLLHRCIAWFKAGESVTMEPVGLKCDELSCSVYAMTCEKRLADKLTRLIGIAGYKIKGFLSAQLGETLLAVPPAERDRTAVLIDCGYMTTQVMVAKGDAVCHMSVIDDGAGFWTARIAQELDIPFQMAEQIKRRLILAPGENTGNSKITLFDASGEEISFDSDTVERIVIKPLSELADTIKSELLSCDIAIGNKTAYYLTGGGLAPMGGARQFLSGRLGVPVRACAVKPTKLMGANYVSSVGLLELVFEQISQERMNSKTDLITKLKSIFKK